MAGASISIESVGKRYRIGTHGAAYVTLREALSSRFGGDAGGSRDVWALRDVSFEVREGEAVGVIGANGAGKSTLLRVLSRITQPTVGVSRTRGRVGSLLEVGTGFHPELTGRENIYLNGAILGMKRREISSRFDEIVDFSGVERFLETPLKRYSSGMYLRLAFAVAAHLDPEVMLVDEVLAVGDARFREKCLGRMSELGAEGRTVLFVSHDLGAVTRLCSRAVWLDHGRVVRDGESADVVERYLREAVPNATSREFEPDPDRRAFLISADVRGTDGRAASAPRRDEELVLAVRFGLRERLPGLSIAFILHGPLGVPVLDEDWGADTGGQLLPQRVPQEYEARLRVPAILTAGEYRLEVWIGTPAEPLVREEALRFQVAPRPDDVQESTRRKRAVQAPVSWSVDEVEGLAPPSESLSWSAP
jgi:ABC-type polysaccharide/polyol phosphate transport system ATPase subunit